MNTVFIFKPLEEKDLMLLFEWLAIPHVAQWWRESRDWKIFEAKYRNWIQDEHVNQFIACVGEKPIGFIGYYDTTGGADFVIRQPKNTYGIDLFIADINYLGKGYGQKMIKEFINKIIMSSKPIKIIVDPETTNVKAIRFYEKVGFKKVREVITTDGQKDVKGVLMEMNFTK